jgi:hypothetical protein
MFLREKLRLIKIFCSNCNFLFKAVASGKRVASPPFCHFFNFTERSDPIQQITTITNHGAHQVYIYIEYSLCLKQIAKNQKRILKFCHVSTHLFQTSCQDIKGF